MESERSDPERGREEGDWGDREASLRVERRARGRKECVGLLSTVID